MCIIRCYRHFFLTALCVKIVQSVNNEERSIASKYIRQKQNVESRNLQGNHDLICETIYRIEVEPDPKNPDFGLDKCEYLCATTGILNGKKDLFMYCLNGLSEKMKTDQDMNFPQGQSSMIIENGNQYRDNESFTISLSSDANLDVFDKNEDVGKRQNLLETTPFPFIGNKNTLVIRVTGNGDNEAMEYTREQLSGFIFGDDDDLLNLKSGYAACSDNQLNIVKAVDNNNPSVINDGVMEVTLSLSTTGFYNNNNPAVLENAISAAAKTALNINDAGTIENYFDFVLMCLPPGTGLSTAYAYVGGKRSVYNNEWCIYPTGLMHEIGHNIGLLHSSEGNVEYGDQSCTMGFSYLGNHEGPKMCFNGGKSWVLGWYQDKSVSANLDISTNPTWNGKLIGVTNYSTDEVSEYKVVVEVVTGNPNDATSQNYYILYNRKDGINSGVPEFGDLVTITQASLIQTSSSLRENDRSFQVAQLTVGQTFEISDFKSSGFGLIIKFCELNTTNNPEYARISIYFSNNSDQCNAADPTSAPSVAPSSEPMNQPSSAPSDTPSSDPISAPSVAPSLSVFPSLKPVVGVSSAPSVASSSEPSNLASSAPSFAPSSEPSIQASSAPSVASSSEPSTQVSSAPSVAPSSFPSPSPSIDPSSSISPTTIPGRCPSGQFAFDLELQTDNFGYETRWKIKSEASDSTVAKSIGLLRSNNFYQHDYCFDDGCYDFTITDAWNDGICCTYGQGYYKGYLYGNTEGEPEFSGGEFTSSRTHRFCGRGSSPSAPTQSPTQQNCPSNETKIKINLLTDRFPQETSFTLEGPGNNLLYDEKTFDKNTQYNYDRCFPVGCYVFTIKDSHGDGICCRYGQGNFEVLSDDEIVLEGSRFGRTASKRFCSCGGGKSFELILRADEYPSETSWELKAADNSIVMNGGAIGDLGCLSDGCYTFYIYDSYGDGICCRYGRGNYKVFYDGVLIDEGGKFDGPFESVTFGSCSFSASAATATPQVIDNSYEKTENGEVEQDETQDSTIGCLLRGITRLFE